ncbi:uncharacterized protein METZ01_LOCUS470083 [marine metagenome]|uniref:Uncharacterized protein n=1 Tax=marine metagenome TaxID=408172 RepID=A0A383BBR2_9ZZZZ
MKNPIISAVLNFFFMGLGYIYNGNRILLGALLTIAAIGLTYVENFHEFAGKTLQAHDSTAFSILFVCVLIANTGLAIDASQEAKKINSEKKEE